MAEVFASTRDRRGGRVRVGQRVSSPTVTRLVDQHPEAVAEALLERVAAEGTPLLEPAERGQGESEVILTFVHERAQAQTVALVTYGPSDPDTLRDSTFEQLPGTGVWHLSLQVSSTWRGSYGIAVHAPAEQGGGGAGGAGESDAAGEQDWIGGKCDGAAGEQDGTGGACHAAAGDRDEMARVATTDAESDDRGENARRRTRAVYERRRLEQATAGLDARGRQAVRRWFEIRRHAGQDPWAREQLNDQVSVASGPDAGGWTFPVGQHAADTAEAGVRAHGRAGQAIGGAAGTLHTLTLPGRRGSDQRVWVHVPAGQAPADGWDVLVLLDGHDWVEAGVAELLDRVAASGLVCPTVTVLVGESDDPHRVPDLMCDQGFVEHLDAVVLPGVGARWPLTSDPERTVIAGQSLGGLTAVYAQALAPHRFGASISQSGAFWWPVDDPVGPQSQWLAGAIERADQRLGRVWLEAGTREASQAAVNRALVETLTGRARMLSYREFDGGHDRACWRARLGEALLATLTPVPHAP